MGEKGEGNKTKSPKHTLVWHGTILVKKDTIFSLARGNKLSILGYRHFRIFVITPKLFTIRNDTSFPKEQKINGVDSKTSKNAQRKMLGTCFH